MVAEGVLSSAVRCSLRLFNTQAVILRSHNVASVE